MQFSYIISDDCEDKKNILSSDPVIGSQSTSERNTRGKYAVNYTSYITRRHRLSIGCLKGVIMILKFKMKLIHALVDIQGLQQDDRKTNNYMVTVCD